MSMIASVAEHCGHFFLQETKPGEIPIIKHHECNGFTQEYGVFEPKKLVGQ